MMHSSIKAVFTSPHPVLMIYTSSSAHRLCDAKRRLANAAPRQLYARDLYASLGTVSH